MARRYNRDSRGRFASGGGGGGGAVRGKGTLAARTSLKRSREKLASNESAAQRGAVTRGANRLKAAQAASRTRLKSPSARFRPGRGTPSPSSAPASNIRATGGIKRTPAASNIRRTTAPRRAPLITRRNAIRSYTPKTPEGIAAQAARQIKRAASAPPDLKTRVRSVLAESKKLTDRLDRQQARAMGNRFGKGIEGRLAGVYMRNSFGKTNRNARQIIQARAQRAADAAARGSKPARRAREIYANQLAFMGGGKAKAAKSNIQPGPRNTQGPPKRSRKRKKPQ